MTALVGQPHQLEVVDTTMTARGSQQEPQLFLGDPASGLDLVARDRGQQAAPQANLPVAGPLCQVSVTYLMAK